MYLFVCLGLVYGEIIPGNIHLSCYIEEDTFLTPLNIMLFEVSGRQHLWTQHASAALLCLVHSIYATELFTFIFFLLVAIKCFKLIAASIEIIIYFHYVIC